MAKTSKLNPDAELFAMLDRIVTAEREIKNVDRAITALKRSKGRVSPERPHHVEFHSDADRARCLDLVKKEGELCREVGDLYDEITYFGPTTRKGFAAWYRAIVESGVGCYGGDDDFWHLAFWVVRRGERLGIEQPPRLRRKFKTDQSETAKRLEGLWKLAAEERVAAEERAVAAGGGEHAAAQ